MTLKVLMKRGYLHVRSECFVLCEGDMTAVSLILRGPQLIFHSCTHCGQEAIFSPVKVIRPQFSKVCPLNSGCHSLGAPV